MIGNLVKMEKKKEKPRFQVVIKVIPEMWHFTQGFEKVQKEP